MKLRPHFLALLLVCLPVFAKQQAAPRQAAQALTVQSEFIADLDDVQQKLFDLANAIPAEKYGWRPEPGVRSVSEVLMHVAGGNYFLATFLGARPPAGVPKDLEKIRDKKRVLEELEKSFAFVRNVASTKPDAELEKVATMAGKPITHRAVFTRMLNHVHEHLGQSIAYARMAGVTPPWSR